MYAGGEKQPQLFCCVPSKGKGHVPHMKLGTLEVQWETCW